MKSVVVLSGKGGAGKSSITASLATVLQDAVCADCDVDAPNLSLFFNTDEISRSVISTNKKAVFDMRKCTKCKMCRETCYFGAIDWKNGPSLNHKCEGCHACRIVCPEGAISLESEKNASIMRVKTSYGFDIVSAQLDIGASGSGKVVSMVKKEASGTKAGLMLIDAPAGIGCPTIASVAGANHAILVVEPTISGMADMKRAISVVENFNITWSAIVNKYDGDDWDAKNVIARLPYDQAFVDTLVNRQPVIEKKFRKEFKEIAKVISCKLSQ